MPEWTIAILAGGIGGLAGAYVTKREFELPGRRIHPDGRRSVTPGILGEILVGMVLGAVFWGLNNPDVIADMSELHPGRIAGALLAGTGGGKMLADYMEISSLRTNMLSMGKTRPKTSRTI